ncbi:10465_t:CDS:2, partial [Dentiscutata erythropus]
IRLFDTNANEWSQMDATGDVIESRIYFSSVLRFNLDTQLYSSSAEVYLYNIKNNKWVTTFNPPTTSPNINPTETSLPAEKSSNL